MDEPAQKWRIGDHHTPQGSRPVKSFIDGLSGSARVKVVAALRLLAEQGNQLRLPKSRSLGGGLHELRIPHPEGPFRIIYCFQPEQHIVLLHAFVKRTEQTPPGDLKIARERKPR